MSGFRDTIDVASPSGGWPPPWPSVAELTESLPVESWTLVGGLMVQLHAVGHGIGITRPTNDVDIVLHVETARGVPNAVANALESLGYRLQLSIDARVRSAHRFVRGATKIDLVAGAREGQVDVLVADHAAPRVVEKLRGHEMIRLEGGTQALRRTINARIEVAPGAMTSISVPRPLGALILKAAAYRTDSRDRDRHLFDAVTLLACIDDPYTDRESFTGSDSRRITALSKALDPDHALWQTLRGQNREKARFALSILAQPQ